MTDADYVIRVKRKREHPWLTRGFISGYTVNGVEGDSLLLDYNREYVFDIDTPGHPFYFTDSEVGDANFQNALFPPQGGVESGALRFKASRDLPKEWRASLLKTGQLQIFYQCGIHPSMGGPVRITAAMKPSMAAAATERIALESVMKLTAPTAMVAHPNDNNVVVVAEQTGKLWGVYMLPENPDVDPSECVWVALDLSPTIEKLNLNRSYDERGLLGFAFHPNFGLGDNRGFLYYSIVSDDSEKQLDHKNCISEITFDMTNVKQCGPQFVADMSSERVLFDVDYHYYNHNGGNLVFHPSRRPSQLHIFTGDGGSQGDPDNRSQNSFDLHGKELCIVVDDVPTDSRFAVPSDNPYVDGARGDPRVRSLGFRNPWGCSFRNSGELWCADVGESRVEEINVITAAGDNYGWSVYEGTVMRKPERFDATANYVAPIYSYKHVEGEGAVIGGHHLSDNIYLFGDYSGLLMLLMLQDDGSWTLLHKQKLPNQQKLRAFGRDGYGRSYALTSPTDGINYGSIYRLRFNNEERLPTAALLTSSAVPQVSEFPSFTEFMRTTAILAAIYVKKLASGADKKVLAATEISLNNTAEAVENRKWKTILIANNNALKDMIVGTVKGNTRLTDTGISGLQSASKDVATLFAAYDATVEVFEPQNSSFYAPVRALWLKYINCIRGYAELGRQVKAGELPLLSITKNKNCVSTAENIGAELDKVSLLAIKTSRGPWDWLKRNVFRPIRDKVRKTFGREKPVTMKQFFAFNDAVVKYIKEKTDDNKKNLLKQKDLIKLTGWRTFVDVMQKYIETGKESYIDDYASKFINGLPSGVNRENTEKAIKGYIQCVKNLVKNPNSPDTCGGSASLVGYELLELTQSTSSATILGSLKRKKKKPFEVAMVGDFPTFESLLLQNMSLLFNYVIASMTTGSGSEISRSSRAALMNQGEQIDDNFWRQFVNSFNKYILSIVDDVLQNDEESAAIAQGDMDATILSAALQFGVFESEDYVKASSLFQSYIECIRSYCESLAQGDAGDPIVLLQLSTCIHLAQDVGKKLDNLAQGQEEPELAMEVVLRAPYRDLFYNYAQALTAYARLVKATGKKQYGKYSGNVNDSVQAIRSKNEELGQALSDYNKQLLLFTDSSAVVDGVTSEPPALVAARKQFISALEDLIGVLSYAENLVAIQSKHYNKFLNGLVGRYNQNTTLQQERLSVASMTDIGTAIDLSNTPSDCPTLVSSQPAGMQATGQLPKNIIDQLKQKQMERVALELPQKNPRLVETIRRREQSQRPPPSPPIPRRSIEDFDQLMVDFTNEIIEYGEALKEDRDVSEQEAIIRQVINIVSTDWTNSVLGREWALLMQRFSLLIINMMRQRLSGDEKGASENTFKLLSLNENVMQYFQAHWKLPRTVFFAAWTHYSECMSTLTAVLANKNIDFTVYQNSKMQCLLNAGHFGRMLDIQFSAVAGKPVPMFIQELEKVRSSGAWDWLKRKERKVKNEIVGSLVNNHNSDGKSNIMERTFEDLNTRLEVYIRAVKANDDRGKAVYKKEVMKLANRVKIQGWALLINMLPDYFEKVIKNGQPNIVLPQEAIIFANSFQNEALRARNAVSGYLRCVAIAATQTADISPCYDTAENTGKMLDRLLKKVKVVSTASAVCQRYSSIPVKNGLPDFSLYLLQNFWMIYGYIYAYYMKDDVETAAESFLQQPKMLSGVDRDVEALLQKNNALMKGIIDDLLNKDENARVLKEDELDAITVSIALLFGPKDSEDYNNAGLLWSRHNRCIIDYVRATLTSDNISYMLLQLSNCVIESEAAGLQLNQLLESDGEGIALTLQAPTVGALERFYYNYATAVAVYAEAVADGTVTNDYAAAVQKLIDASQSELGAALADALSDYSVQLLLLADSVASIGSGGVRGENGAAILKSDSYLLTEIRYQNALKKAAGNGTEALFQAQTERFFNFLDALAGLRNEVFQDYNRQLYLALSAKLGAKLDGNFCPSSTNPQLMQGLLQELDKEIADRRKSGRLSVICPASPKPRKPKPKPKAKPGRIFPKRRPRPKLKPRAKTVPIQLEQQELLSPKRAMRALTMGLMGYAEALKTGDAAAEKNSLQLAIDTVRLDWAYSKFGMQWASIMQSFVLAMVKVFLAWMSDTGRERNSIERMGLLITIGNGVEAYFEALGIDPIGFSLRWMEYYSCMYWYAAEIATTPSLDNENYLFKKQSCINASDAFAELLEQVTISSQPPPEREEPRKKFRTLPSRTANMSDNNNSINVDLSEEETQLLMRVAMTNLISNQAYALAEDESVKIQNLLLRAMPYMTESQRVEAYKIFVKAIESQRLRLLKDELAVIMKLLTASRKMLELSKKERELLTKKVIPTMSTARLTEEEKEILRSMLVRLMTTASSATPINPSKVLTAAEIQSMLTIMDSMLESRAYKLSDNERQALINIFLKATATKSYAASLAEKKMVTQLITSKPTMLSEDEKHMAMRMMMKLLLATSMADRLDSDEKQRMLSLMYSLERQAMSKEEADAMEAIVRKMMLLSSQQLAAGDEREAVMPSEKQMKWLMILLLMNMISGSPYELSDDEKRQLLRAMAYVLASRDCPLNEEERNKLIHFAAVVVSKGPQRMSAEQALLLTKALTAVRTLKTQLDSKDEHILAVVLSHKDRLRDEEKQALRRKFMQIMQTPSTACPVRDEEEPLLTDDEVTDLATLVKDMLSVAKCAGYSLSDEQKQLIAKLSMKYMASKHGHNLTEEEKLLMMTIMSSKAVTLFHSDRVTLLKLAMKMLVHFASVSNKLGQEEMTAMKRIASMRSDQLSENDKQLMQEVMTKMMPVSSTKLISQSHLSARGSGAKAHVDRHVDLFVVYLKTITTPDKTKEVTTAKEMSDHLLQMSRAYNAIAKVLGMVMTQTAELAVALVNGNKTAAHELSLKIKKNTKAMKNILEKAGLSETVIEKFLTYTHRAMHYVHNQTHESESSLRLAGGELGQQLQIEDITPSSAVVFENRAEESSTPSIILNSETFEQLMKEHVNLAIRYAELLYSQGIGSRPAMNASQNFINQADHWPFNAYGSTLFMEHTKLEKQLIDSIFEMDETKKNALLQTLSENGEQLIQFWNRAARGDKAEETIIRSIWKDHLDCTQKYAEALRTGGPTSANYDAAIRLCRYGAQIFGQHMDGLFNPPSSAVVFGNSDEESSTPPIILNSETFEQLMKEHVNLAIRYAELLYSQGIGSRPAVNASQNFINQADHWPFNAYGSTLFMEHTKLEKQLIDSIFEMDETKKNALLQTLSENGEQLIQFWNRAARGDKAEETIIRSIWKDHLDCTQKYAEALRTGGPTSANYDAAIRLCRYGAQIFGQHMDGLFNPPSSAVVFGNSDEESSTPPIILNSETFEQLMEQHVRLTIRYAELAFSEGIESTAASTAVQELLRQARTWPFNDNGQRLLVEHTQSVKQLIDSIFEMDETKRTKALRDLSSNMEEFVAFLSAAAKKMKNMDIEKPVRMHWKTHLECTQNYTKALEAGGASSANYKAATKDCIDKGIDFGLYLDSVFA